MPDGYNTLRARKRKQEARQTLEDLSATLEETGDAEKDLKLCVFYLNCLDFIPGELGSGPRLEKEKDNRRYANMIRERGVLVNFQQACESLSESLNEECAVYQNACDPHATYLAIASQNQHAPDADKERELLQVKWVQLNKISRLLSSFKALISDTIPPKHPIFADIKKLMEAIKANKNNLEKATPLSSHAICKTLSTWATVALDIEEKRADDKAIAKQEIAFVVTLREHIKELNRAIGYDDEQSIPAILEQIKSLLLQPLVDDEKDEETILSTKRVRFEDEDVDLREHKTPSWLAFRIEHLLDSGLLDDIDYIGMPPALTQLQKDLTEFAEHADSLINPPPGDEYVIHIKH